MKTTKLARVFDLPKDQQTLFWFNQVMQHSGLPEEYRKGLEFPSLSLECMVEVDRYEYRVHINMFQKEKPARLVVYGVTYVPTFVGEFDPKTMPVPVEETPEADAVPTIVNWLPYRIEPQQEYLEAIPAEPVHEQVPASDKYKSFCEGNRKWAEAILQPLINDRHNEALEKHLCHCPTFEMVNGGCKCGGI